jgi:ABC-type multidrug transport system fused ATPase/permease subunit
MPVTVTVSRGNPLPAPIALLFSLVGAGLIVFGFVGPVGEINMPDDGSGADTILTVVAIALAGPALILYVLSLLRHLYRARPDVTAGIPDELPEPPANHDPAIVGVLVGAGKPPRRSVAGTVLSLATRDALSINEYGEKIVITPKPNITPANEGEALVLSGLMERADEKGEVVGPPFWDGRVGWWRAFVRDARNRASAAGLLEARIPLVGLMVTLILVGTGLSLIFFWRIPVFVGLIIFVNGFPHLIARVSGYRLSDEGRRLRATWLAFARYLRNQGSLRDVGPAGVVMWGPNLVYGAVLGQAEKAARPLSPDADEEEPIEPMTTTKVIDL